MYYQICQVAVIKRYVYCIHSTLIEYRLYLCTIILFIINNFAWLVENALDIFTFQNLTKVLTLVNFMTLVSVFDYSTSIKFAILLAVTYSIKLSTSIYVKNINRRAIKPFFTMVTLVIFICVYSYCK